MSPQSLYVACATAIIRPCSFSPGATWFCRIAFSTGASLIIHGGRITAIEPKFRDDMAGATVVDVRECYVVPGFVDVHVHGVRGMTRSTRRARGGDCIAIATVRRDRVLSHDGCLRAA